MAGGSAGNVGGPGAEIGGGCASLRLVARVGKAHGVEQSGCWKSVSPGPLAAESYGRFPEGEIQQDKERDTFLKTSGFIENLMGHHDWGGPLWPTLSPFLSCTPKPD